MAMNKQLNELLNRKMDRRDFIKHVGVGTLAVFGLGSAVKLMTSLGNTSTTAGGSSTTQPVAATAGSSNQQLTYGSGAYGGRRSRA